MDFDTYQVYARETAIYGESVTSMVARHAHSTLERILRLHYVTLKLNGEAGELAEEVAKAMRDDYGNITNERRDAIEKELGDVLWYISGICEEMGFELDVVAQVNIQKLRQRKERDKLHGSGSNR